MSCDLSDPNILKAWNEIMDGKETNWLILGYHDTRDRISLYSKGTGGLAELKENLLEDVLYGFFRIEGRFVLLTFIADTVSGVRKARALVHGRAVGALFKQSHQAQISAAKVDDVNEITIRNRLKLVMGAGSPPTSPNRLIRRSTLPPTPPNGTPPNPSMAVLGGEFIADEASAHELQRKKSEREKEIQHLKERQATSTNFEKIRQQAAIEAQQKMESDRLKQQGVEVVQQRQAAIEAERVRQAQALQEAQEAEERHIRDAREVEERSAREAQEAEMRKARDLEEHQVRQKREALEAQERSRRATMEAEELSMREALEAEQQRQRDLQQTALFRQQQASAEQRQLVEQNGHATSDQAAHQRAQDHALEQQKLAEADLSEQRLRHQQAMDTHQRQQYEFEQRQKSEADQRLVREQEQRAKRRADAQKREEDEKTVATRIEAEKVALTERRRLEKEYLAQHQEQARQEKLRAEQERIEREQLKRRDIEQLKTKYASLEASGQTSLTGHITVQGGNSMYWKRRYFVLHGKQFILYKDQLDTTPVDTIDLIPGTVSRIDLDVQEELLIPHSFRLEFRSAEPYLFYLDEQQQKDDVVAGIAQAAEIRV